LRNAINKTNGLCSISVVVGIVALTITVPLSAADPSKGNDNWDNLKELAPVDDIRIVLNDAKSYAAKFQSVSDEAIVVGLVTGEQTFSRARVLRVSTKGKPHRLRNALIGAGIGAGIAAGAFGAKCSSDPEACAYNMALGVPGAGVGGAVIGALVPTGGWHDVYRAR
jgi:hypothetical protein